MPPRHVFEQTPRGRGSVEERVALDHGKPWRRDLERPFAEVPRGIAEPLKRGIGRLLRWLGLLLFASPLFAAGRFILGHPLPRVADWLLVLFVLLVCLFFAVLNLFIVASVAAWIVRNRERVPYLVEPRRPILRLREDEAAETSAPGQRVLARGTVTRLEPREESGPLIIESWSREERRTEADDFAIRRTGEALPVVVRLETAPRLVGARELREGDTVTVVGTVKEIARSTDRIELGPTVRRLARRPGEEVDDDPYRTAPAGPAVVLGDTLEDPVTIVVEPKAAR